MNRIQRAQRRKYHIIYKTTCVETDKWYIGMHSTDDLNDGYKGSGMLLSRSIKKYGKDSHICEILEFCVDRETLATREREIITEVKSDPLCMNIAHGGIGNAPGYFSPEESKLKNSLASKLMWEKRKAEGYIPQSQSPESVAKRAAANTGKRRNEEQKQNLHAGQQSYYATVDKEILNERGQKAAATRTKNGTNLGGRPKGTPMSQEQKVKQSTNQRGKLAPCSIRASCLTCKKETTIGALKQFHGKCI